VTTLSCDHPSQVFLDHRSPTPVPVETAKRGTMLVQALACAAPARPHFNGRAQAKCTCGKTRTVCSAHSLSPSHRNTLL